MALAFTTGIGGFAAFYFIFFLFNGLINSPRDTLFNERVGEKQRSTLLSFQSFFLQLGGVLGALLIGYLARTYSIPLSWIVSSALFAATGIFYMFLRNDGREDDRL